MAGLPPLSGFLGKFLLLRAALDHPWWPWVLGTVLAGSLLGLIALARSGSLLFYRARPAEGAPPPRQAGLTAELAPFAGLLLLGVGLTVAAGPLSDYARATADQLLQPYHYVHAVLGGGGR